MHGFMNVKFNFILVNKWNNIDTMYLSTYLGRNNIFFTVCVYYVTTNKIYGAATLNIIVLVFA
jgi:hypothetical protein